MPSENNRGALWKKQNRTEKQPIYSGRCIVGHVGYEFAVWPERTSEKGHAWLPVTFKPLEHDEAPQQRQEQQPAERQDNQDIPF